MYIWTACLCVFFFNVAFFVVVVDVSWLSAGSGADAASVAGAPDDSGSDVKKNGQ